MLEGPEKAYQSIIETCILMADDHGADDARDGMYYTNNARAWAKRQRGRSK